jgi:hypothetical protein
LFVALVLDVNTRYCLEVRWERYLQLTSAYIVPKLSLPEDRALLRGYHVQEMKGWTLSSISLVKLIVGR